MILAKRILLYIGIAIVVFIIAYYLHMYILKMSEVNMPFDLLSIYLFQAIASLLIIITFEMIASLNTQFKDQLGFLYLGSIAVKMLFFGIFFRDLLFSSIDLSKMDSLSMLIPMFIFIFFEVVIIAKILNRIT